MLILKDGSYVTNLPKVLVAIPAYNEEECIEGTILELKRVALSLTSSSLTTALEIALELCTNLGCNVINMLINCGLTVDFKRQLVMRWRMITTTWFNSMRMDNIGLSLFRSLFRKLNLTTLT